MFWHFFFPTVWLVWVVYWFVSARGNKTTARRESLRTGLPYRLLLYLGLILFIHRQWRFAPWLNERIIHPAALFVPLGALLLVLGLGFSVWARVHLGANWSAIVTLKKDHELIRTGPYGWVRHPIYTGILVGFLGSILALGEWRGIIAFVLFTASFIVKLRIEERWMTEVFGDAYTRYKAEVPALFPGIY